MSHRMSLLEDYNRQMRRRMGRESLAEKLEAIRQGGGFRPGTSGASQRPQGTTTTPPTVDAQVPLFEC